MEAKIMDVLRRMQPVLDEMQLRELKDIYRMQSNPGNGPAGCRQELGSGSGRVSDE